MIRVRVGIIYDGVEQYFWREGEIREGKKYVLKQLFTPDKRQAAVLSEQLGIAFVEKLRAAREVPWLEDIATSRRINPPRQNVPTSGEDNRVPMRASLDDVNCFVVRPANTPNGPKWFIKCTIPGRPNQEIIYADDPLAALQRASDVGFLVYGERAPAPQPVVQQVAQVLPLRKRPGSI